jgi:protein SCO1/2
VVIGLEHVLVIWQVFTQDYTYQGSLIDPPVPAADFELTDQHGQTFRLSDQRGKVVLIFFGYTHCPDVCPVTLSEFKQIKSKLGNQVDDISFVFITVDPERDTLEKLGDHLANFDAGFIGLSGDRSSLEEVWMSFGVYQAKQETGSAAGYLVDHTARVYAIDVDGNWRLTYPFGMESDKLFQDVRHLIQEG